MSVPGLGTGSSIKKVDLLKLATPLCDESFHSSPVRLCDSLTLGTTRHH